MILERQDLQILFPPPPPPNHDYGKLGYLHSIKQNFSVKYFLLETANLFFIIKKVLNGKLHFCTVLFM